jgi:hypothetical protein
MELTEDMMVVSKPVSQEQTMATKQERKKVRYRAEKVPGPGSMVRASWNAAVRSSGLIWAKWTVSREAGSPPSWCSSFSFSSWL